jgi:hypothetical protein
VHEFHPTPAMRILDIGGTDLNWRIVEQPARVVLLNTKMPEGGMTSLTWDRVQRRVDRAPPQSVEYVLGDGKSVPYANREFDICFSNSTIEHLFQFGEQRRFANEVRRVARGVWVQTPARRFPFEPHWLSPLVHWLPRSWQKHLVRNFTVYVLDAPTNGERCFSARRRIASSPIERCRSSSPL